MTRKLKKIDRAAVALAALSAVGAALILLRELTYGVTLHWDGINYIAVARNLLDGHAFIGMQEKPFTRWPPLYPILLAASSFFVFDPRDVAGLVSAALFGATIFACGLWMRRRLSSRFLAAWGFLALTLSVPLTWMASWAMSEPLFILMAVLALICLDGHLRGGKASLLIWAAAFTAAAFLTRWAGVALILSALPLLALQRGVALPQKAVRVAIYAIISITPICLYILRNFLVSGFATGYSRVTPETAASFSDTAQIIIRIIGRWIIPDLSWETYSFAAQALAAAAIIALACGVAYAAARFALTDKRDDGARGPMGSCGRSSVRRVSFCVFGGFALGYIVFFTASAVTSASADLGLSYRYLTPLFAPLTIAFLIAADAFFARTSDWTSGRASDGWKSSWAARSLPIAKAAGIWERLAAKAPKMLPKAMKGRRLNLAAIAIAAPLCVWLAHTALLSVSAVIVMNTEGLTRQSYSNAQYANSEVLEYLRNAAPAGEVASNQFAATYIHVGGGARHTPLPAESKYMRRWAESAKDGDYAVWFNGRHWAESIEYDDALLRELMQPAAELSDGAVFRIDKPYAESAQPGQPALMVRSFFDLYIQDNAVIYAKEPCSVADTEARFFVHIFPESANSLPLDRRKFRFNNIGFNFYETGEIRGGRCSARLQLPDYAVAEIKTGQYTREGKIWEERLRLDRWR